MAIAAATGIVAASLAQGAAADSSPAPQPAQQLSRPATSQPGPSSPSPAAATAAAAPGTAASAKPTPSATASAKPTPAPTPTPTPKTTASPTSGAATAAGPTAKAATAAPTPAAAEAAIRVPGAIGVEYERLGGATGPVGPATAGQKCGLAGGGCQQSFAHGTIVWSEATGARLLSAGIENAWLKAGGVTGHLAYPLGAARCGGAPVVCQQAFQHGSLYSVTGKGTYPVWGAINATYESLGGLEGYLGYPIAVETCGLTGGACTQRFQRGAVYFAPGAGTFPVWGAINARYLALGGSRGYLGYPTGQEKCGLRGGGCSQAFQRGRIYYAAGAGTQAVWGGLGQFYTARKAQAGALGYPVTAEACNRSGYCSQSFQYGRLEWIPGTGVRYRLTPAAYCPAISSGAVKYRTGGASRVSFAIADTYRSTRITFITCVRQPDGSYAKEWGALGHAGESGFAAPGVATGPTWQMFSPTGSFTVTQAFGLGNPGTALSYRTLNPYSRWGGRLNGNYNKYFESSSDVFPDENMWYFATRPSHDYRQGVVINYNRPPDAPITMNAGFAIFLHGNNLPTWGCISLNDGDLLQYLRTAHPGDRFVMGVAYDIFN
ncbi:L,D-transpeptidase family protein [Arthrobacter sp. Bi26]|uniref:L,D-transpeptidase family protein n=1 Tax=Arthrobacter sp. Bi26 TaxID=2822350 RepID=UPI001E33D461|nr:L,D-transpeptidase family protein [Arthrobacter sp. Bi26]